MILLAIARWPYRPYSINANGQLIEQTFAESAPGWRFVFGDMADVLSRTHVAKFSGLSPKINDDRVTFARALGIQASGLERLNDVFGSLDQVDLISDDDSDGEDDSGKKKPIKKKWRQPMSGLELSIAARGKIYLRWLEHDRRLLNFPLVTQKRLVYKDLNVLLAHVLSDFGY